MKEKMKQVSEKLDELKLKANSYTNKRNQALRDIGWQLTQAVKQYIDNERKNETSI